MPPKLGHIEHKNILKKYIPNQKMRFLAWTRLKWNQIQDTMFENMIINEDNIQLDITILDELWCVSKTKKKVRKRSDSDQKSPQNKGREFMGSMHPRRCICASLFRFKKLKDPKDIKSVKDVINDIKNAENIEDINYLYKVTKIIPSNNEIEQFKNHPKVLQLKDMNETQRNKMVNKFPFLERFWYYCVDIPDALKRCRLQMLRLELEEFCPFQYENIKLLNDMYNKLYNNEKIGKILELVLNIGNYLNYPRIAKGCSLDTFHLLKYSRSNSDQMYSLLIYLVEMVNDNYPELSNWVGLFNDVRLHDLDRMRTEFNGIHSALIQYRNHHVLNLKLQKILDKMDSDFKEIDDEYNKIETKCHTLARHLGTVDATFNEFCKILINIKADWNAAQNLVERSKNIYIALVCGYIGEFEK
eukprot:468212_1